jgi:hypothetical protein
MQNNLSLQDAFPGNVVANHMVNANAVTEAFMNMSKPFMNKELASKVRILIRSNKMQQYAGIYLAQNHSTCFGCPSHP